ncbi:MAG: aldehyde dehydrogenase family protein [Chitinophagaceae bacterium]|nr:MAG: aldehyde dehydrogenase family protein [Chitinophagaceae bacterium]
MKKIGISFSRTNFRYYWEWWTEEDLKDDVKLIELSFEKNNTEDIALCDAFVLTGGVDIHPSFYNGVVHYPNRPESFEINRDIFEKKIYEYSQHYKLPLLAICRGMQLVNVLEGGKLIQDLDAANSIHKKDTADKTHIINVQSPSLLKEITDKDVFEINSAHHQAIDPSTIGESLVVSAVSKNDSIIEAIEFKNKDGKAFMLGVQWHPERMDQKELHPFSENIKRQFLREVRKTNMKKLSITNPATEQIIAELNVDTKESIQTKFEVLLKGQQRWQEITLTERIDILQNFSSLLQKNIEQLAAVLTSEMGKPLQQSRNEINGACTRIKWLTENAAKYLADEIMTDEENMQEKIAYEPLGVVCNISAWNYPYLVGVNVFIPALLGGNAVMYKPSEYASLTGLQIEKLWQEAGIPDDVFQVAIGKGEVGEFLLDLPFDGYFFTGSHKTGKYIYQRVAPKMVPCQCELGGKDPLYVADDVTDIKGVAAATADGVFYNNGQSCCAVERIYVHEKVYDQYVDEFVKEVNGFKIGVPTDDGIYIGPLSRKEQVAVLQQQIDDAVTKGATVLAGGKKSERGAYYFEPTVLANVNHQMQVMKDESFGPIIGIMKVVDDKEAIELMNDTDYGLTASVYSCRQERAENILRELNTGTGYWNCCDRVSAALPWSGRKASGFGSTLSYAGLRAFVKPKAYHLRK